MRVLFVGDAVVSSGFARATHAACDALHARGHEVHVLGINYYGDGHTYPYRIYPCVQPLDQGRDQMGVTRLPRMIQRLEPDVVVILQDPWNIPDYLDTLEKRLADDIKMPKIIGWLAVDSENQKGLDLNRLDAVAVWTYFAEIELRRGGYLGPLHTVQLGIDPSIFYRRDRDQSRKMTLPPDAYEKNPFVVGVVGRNQHRKRLDLTIRVFSEFVHSLPDKQAARLFLHVGPTGDSGYDLPSLCDYYGVRGLVMQSKPEIGEGIQLDHMAYMYSAFDVYLSTSQGEGWGLPAQEAMACGVPCIVPNWGSFGDHGWMTGEEAIKIPCGTQLVTAPVNGKMHTVGAIPDLWATVDALKRVYRLPDVAATLAERGRQKATSLTLEATGSSMANLVESIL